MPKANPSDKRSKLEAQRAKLNEEINRLRTLEQKQQRKEATRRKLLVGAMILHRMEVESDHWPTGRLLDTLDTFLTRDSERALFDLPPKPASR